MYSLYVLSAATEPVRPFGQNTRLTYQVSCRPAVLFWT